MIGDRNKHKSQVIDFLQRQISRSDWELMLPKNGTGQETYFASAGEWTVFVKLGAYIERYQTMSQIGISPRVIASGYLENGTSILVQQEIRGRKPSRLDFRLLLAQFAEAIRTTHRNAQLIKILPQRQSNSHRDAGLAVLGEIVQRWEFYRVNVPLSAAYVDEKLAYLKQKIEQFPGSGLVASHGDICNANWIVTADRKVYLVDYESMAQDDPALDMGAILWWYYPPHMRERFLRIAGYRNDVEFRSRMRVRMALHSLKIILPRKESFDKFNASAFEQSLEDFTAVINGEQNPQGYYS